MDKKGWQSDARGRGIRWDPNSASSGEGIKQNPRGASWTQLSLCLERFEWFMVPAVQGLGRLDGELAAADAAFLALSEVARGRFQAENPFDLADRFTRSYLWVLGAYEIVRSLHQRTHAAGLAVMTAEQKKIVRDVKQKFERIRLPLAKFEPARRHRTTDSGIAFPVIHEQLGISWKLAPDAYISREDLAREFRSLLEALSSKP